MCDQREIVFRLAETSDAAQLADLRWRLKKEDCQDFAVGERDGFISTFVESDPRTSIIARYFHWVADLNWRVIGVMSVFKVPKMPSPRESGGTLGYLTNCYTLPAHRSQGIGSRLLSRVTIWAKQEGLELLFVWPSETSYKFYQRNGFDRLSDPLVLQIPDS